MPVKHYHLETVDSTQTHAKALLDANEAAPFLVTAAQQTAGRGRLDRQWISPPGNFYGSLAWRAGVPTQRYSEYSFLTAVTVRSTLAEAFDGDFMLKWPNDILLDGRKCAGILIESSGAKNENLIIGMGVNLRHAPPDYVVRMPAIALWPDAPMDAQLDARFSELLIENFQAWHADYLAAGFDMVRVEWLSHAYNLGQQITVQTPAETLTGIFTGIDEQGNLLLTQGPKTRKITTADVS